MPESMNCDFVLNGTFTLNGQVEATRLSLHLGNGNFSVSNADKAPPKRKLILSHFCGICFQANSPSTLVTVSGIPFPETNSASISTSSGVKGIFVASKNGLLSPFTASPNQHRSGLMALRTLTSFIFPTATTEKGQQRSLGQGAFFGTRRGSNRSPGRTSASYARGRPLTKVKRQHRCLINSLAFFVRRKN